jgi:hypothetical protein
LPAQHKICNTVSGLEEGEQQLGSRHLLSEFDIGPDVIDM